MEHTTENTKSNLPVEGEPLEAAAKTSRSPKITSIAWAKMNVDVVGDVKDVKLWPGGGRAWDWGETGTRHSPGIQVADVEELIEHGAVVVVLSRGMEERLGVPDSTVDALRARGIEVHVAETKVAVALYNELANSVAHCFGGEVCQKNEQSQCITQGAFKPDMEGTLEGRTQRQELEEAPANLSVSETFNTTFFTHIQRELLIRRIDD